MTKVKRTRKKPGALVGAPGEYANATHSINATQDAAALGTRLRELR